MATFILGMLAIYVVSCLVVAIGATMLDEDRKTGLLLRITILAVPSVLVALYITVFYK